MERRYLGDSKAYLLDQKGPFLAVVKPTDMVQSSLDALVTTHVGRNHRALLAVSRHASGIALYSPRDEYDFYKRALIDANQIKRGVVCEIQTPAEMVGFTTDTRIEYDPQLKVYVPSTERRGRSTTFKRWSSRRVEDDGQHRYSQVFLANPGQGGTNQVRAHLRLEGVRLTTSDAGSHLHLAYAYFTHSAVALPIKLTNVPDWLDLGRTRSEDLLTEMHGVIHDPSKVEEQPRVESVTGHRT